MRRPIALCLAALAPFPAAAQQEEMVWIYNRYVEPNPLNTYLGLVYGIPETDAMQASISCAIGANWVYATVDLGTDVEGYADGATVPVQVVWPSFRSTYDGTVFRHEEGIWGVSLAIPLDDPFWPLMDTGAWMTYGVPGRPPAQLPLGQVGVPLHAFLGDCTNIGELQPTGEGEPASK
ncbi:MAG: hypothetical protein KDK12_13120 [Rhodobacteraceae bacterium]|nr:hypothetical protein [Paracoccaceae bacterium]